MRDGSTMRAGSPPRCDDAEAVARLRADLVDAEWTVDHVKRLIGPVASGALARGQTTPARIALREALAAARIAAGGTEDRPVGDAQGCAHTAGSPPASGPSVRPVEATVTLTRLFQLYEPVSAHDVERALPRLGVLGATAMGLLVAVERDADRGRDAPSAVRAACDLTPYAGSDDLGEFVWWIASDLGELAVGGVLRHDHVLGIGGASRTLAQATVRDRRARALDLGTGCGIQALHLSRHADVVVATDVAERALGYAAFNAALAGVSIDLRLGSLLDPVRGEQFDLVVSNPPFVITPRAIARDDAPDEAGASAVIGDYTYRDGGMSGDDLVRELVRDLSGVLAPGGVAQLLGNWEHRADEPWRKRVGAWMTETGVDAWVLQRDVLDPAQYAETWLRDGGLSSERDPRRWAMGYSEWLADLAARDVEAIGLGMVTLRRPAKPREPWTRVEEIATPLPAGFGQTVSAALAAVDAIARCDDDALLAHRLAVAPDVTEERHHLPGEADPSVLLLRQGGGLGRVWRVGTATAAFVGACDGELTGSQILEALSVLLGVEPGVLAGEIVPIVRELLVAGALGCDAFPR